jgi:hypothetical protein
MAFKWMARNLNNSRVEVYSVCELEIPAVRFEVSNVVLTCDNECGGGERTGSGKPPMLGGLNVKAAGGNRRKKSARGSPSN